MMKPPMLAKTSTLIRLLAAVVKRGRPPTRGNRVVATGGPRVAPGDPAQGEPASPQTAVLGHGFEGVRRAGGVVAADLAVERTDHRPIGAQQADQQVGHDVRPWRPRHAHTDPGRRPAPANWPAPAAGSARTTRMVASGAAGGPRAGRRPGDAGDVSTRLRTTALPTALLTTKPARAWSCADPSSAAVRSPRGGRRCGRPARRPLRVTWRKDFARVRRWCGRPGRTTIGDGSTSDGELAATLATAGRQDGAARARAHAQSEAVRLVAAPVVRLVGTLAHEQSLLRWRACSAGRPVAAHGPGSSTPPSGAAVRRPHDRITVRGALPAGQTHVHASRRWPQGRFRGS